MKTAPISSPSPSPSPSPNPPSTGTRPDQELGVDQPMAGVGVVTSQYTPVPEAELPGMGKAKLPESDIQIGQLVHFSIGGGGLYPPVLRPLIVTSYSKVPGEPVKVRGLLLFDSETDRHQPWVQLTSKVTPLPNSPITWASGPYGHNIGEWRYPGDLR